MEYLLPLLILIYCHEIKGVLEWTVIGKVTDYGQNVTLFCNVPTCCPEDAGWDRWTPHQRTLFIDVKTGRSNKKYDGKVMKDGYTLIIQNLTEHDLNVSYSCLYGVTFGERKFLLKEDVFTYITTTEPNDSQSSKGAIAALLTGVVLVLSLGIFIYCWKIKRKECEKKKEDMQMDNNTEYVAAVTEGEELRSFVRIQVVGKESVGKTTLVRRLLGQHIKQIESTDGIDVTVDKFKIRTRDGKWIFDKVQTEREKIIARIQQVVKLNQTNDHQLASSITPKKNPNKPALRHNVNRSLQTEQIEKDQLSTGGVGETNETDAKKLLKNTTEMPHIQMMSSDPTINFVDDILQEKAIIDELNEKEHVERMERISLLSQSNQSTISADEKNQVIETVIENMEDIISAARKEERQMKSDELVECGIWDFAGQKDYYATHQSFCTRDAIYLLVTDVTTKIEPDNNVEFDSIGEYIGFWLDSIHCFCNDSQKGTVGKICPPVILVCTCMDKVKKRKEEKKRLYTKAVYDTFKEQKKIDHLRKIHFISNKDRLKEDIKTLQQDISDIAEEMHYFAEKRPTKFIYLEHAITVLKAVNVKEKEGYCEKLEDIQKLAEENSIDKKELDLFLDYQHKIGNIIYFRDIPDYVILQPFWLVQCFRCLVCDENHYDECFKSFSHEIKENGKLSGKMIDILFNKEKDLNFGKFKNHILNVMDTFDIILKPKDLETNKDVYYMPCMIENISSLNHIFATDLKLKNPHRTPWLVLEFEFLPLAYFNHIMFNYIRKYEVFAKSGKLALYKDKAIVYLDKINFKLLIICFSKNAVSLQVYSAEQQLSSDANDTTYECILNNLCRGIKNLKKQFMHTLSYTIKAKCSTGDYCQKQDRISMKELTSTEKYFCQEHEEFHSKEDICNTWLKFADIEEKRQAEEEMKMCTNITGQQVDRSAGRQVSNSTGRQVSRSTGQQDDRSTEKPSDDERNSYMKAIEFGLEDREYVRIQVIGKDRVGKTSLVYNLLGYGRHDGKSTDGIEINRKCQIRKKDGEWIIGKDETKRRDMIRRILKATIEKQKGQDRVSGTSSLHNKLHPKTRSEGLDEQPKTNVDTNITSIDSNSKSDEDQLIIEESTKTTKRKETKNHEPMPGSSIEVLHNKNHDYDDNADNITEAIIENMKEIISGAKFEKDKTTSEGLVECGIWDFAGQKEYYATHQTFFTSHAIYLLVTDITEDIRDIQQDENADFDRIGEYIEFWFDSIHCFCTNPLTNKLCPPVIMVCTGMDKVDKVEERKREYERNFHRIFGHQQNINHSRGIHFISNKYPDEKEFQSLKEHIWQIATEMNYFSEKRPTRWINLENALEVLKDMGETVYSWQNTVKLAQENSIGEQELVLFLNYHHKIGYIIFFYDKPDYIILQPYWLVKCFRCLICDDKKMFSSQTGTKMLKVKGELSETLLDELFEKDSDLNFREYKAHILDVMEKFDIIVKPTFSNSDSKLYYMPCMIETSSSLKEIKGKCFTAQCHCTPWLVLEFEFLPVTYYNHIMYDYIRQYTVCEEEPGHPAIYKGKAVVYIDDTYSKLLIICFSKNAICLQIWEWSDANAKLYENILKELCGKIDQLEEKSNHNLHYKIKAKCSKGDYSQSLGRISYEELTSQCKETEKYNCKDPKHKGEWHNKNEIENTWLKYATAVSR